VDGDWAGKRDPRRGLWSGRLFLGAGSFGAAAYPVALVRSDELSGKRHCVPGAAIGSFWRARWHRVHPHLPRTRSAVERRG
jgi:hypothetical protein